MYRIQSILVLEYLKTRCAAVCYTSNLCSNSAIHTITLILVTDIGIYYGRYCVKVI